MTDPLRQEILSQAHTVVIKVGTNVLAGDNGSLDRDRIHQLADQVQRIRSQGRKVAIVSSGAIGAGLGRLELGQRPTDLRHLQACASVGQAFLMRAYQDSFDRHHIQSAQILLTASDFDNRARYLNVRNTILTLFEWGVVPIINENDTVSVAEIKFGDNDHLAAMVTNLIQAPLLILLTVTDGLFTADPRNDNSARRVATIENINSSVLRMVGDSKSSLGTGGMRTKLRAARLATAAGESVIIADGSQAGSLDEIFAARSVGTLFLPQRSNLPAWKRWIGLTARPKGTLLVNDGAKAAVQTQGKSLLAVGIVGVNGEFGKGDVVELAEADGIEFARGLTNYSSDDVAAILGKRTDKIFEVLGSVPYEEVVHRDNLALVD